MEFYRVPLRQMVGLDKIKPRDPTEFDIPAMVAQVCKFEVPDNTATALRSHDLQPIKEHLHNLDATQQLSETTEQLLEADMDPALGLTYQSVNQYLQGNLPKSEYELTPTGLRRTVSPSHSEDTKFLWKCAVAENPFHVMWLFSKHMLTARDVECLLEVYPEIHAEISAQFIAHILESYPSDSSIPRPLRIMLAIFFQNPTIKLEQVAAYKKKPSTPPEQLSSPPNISQLETK